MKTTIAAIALATLMAIPAQAEQPTQDVCQSIGDLAEVIMQRRQEGVAMSTLMQINTQDLELMRVLIIEAYNTPRMSVPENQRREVEDFRNMAEALCYRAMN